MLPRNSKTIIIDWILKFSIIILAIFKIEMCQNTASIIILAVFIIEIRLVYPSIESAIKNGVAKATPLSICPQTYTPIHISQKAPKCVCDYTEAWGNCQS